MFFPTPRLPSVSIGTWRARPGDDAQVPTVVIAPNNRGTVTLTFDQVDELIREIDSRINTFNDWMTTAQQQQKEEKQ